MRHPFALFTLLLPPIAFSQYLDPGFNGTGYVYADPTNASELGAAVVARADGGCVMAGTYWDGSYHIILHALTSTGVADAGFGTNGTATYDEGDANWEQVRMRELADGSFVVAARRTVAEESDVVILRFLADGTRDITFGGAGNIVLDGSAFDSMSDLAAMPDGGFIVHARLGDTSTEYIRYHGDGTIASGFGTNGHRAFGNAMLPYRMFPMPDGKVLLTGMVNVEGDNDTWVARLLDDGSFDPAFGTNGEVIMDLDPHTSEFVFGDIGTGLGTDPQGNITVMSNTGGMVIDNGFYRLVRLLPNGTRDMTYGGDGTAEVFPQDFDNSLSWIFVEGDGRAVILTMRNDELVMEKRLVNGQLDTGWGSSGTASISFPDVFDAEIIDMGRDGSGRLIGGGSVRDTEGDYRLLGMRIGNDAANGITDEGTGDGPQLFPNPSDGAVRLGNMPPGIQRVELLDASGRRVWSTGIPHLTNSTYALDLPSSLSPGTYTLLLTASGSRSAIHLVRR